MMLASELSFTASFRTQFYIILAGVFWLLLSFVLVLTGKGSRRLPIFLSGASFGLACYSYFVFLFFLPAFLLMLWDSVKTQKRVSFLTWILGLSVGLLPYLAGYVSLAIALGGLEEGLQWIRNALTGLSPMSSKLSVFNGVSFSFENLRHALTNEGNEAMIFSSSIGNAWASLKASFFIGVLAFSVAWSFASRWMDGVWRVSTWLVIAIGSYMLAAGFLGNRLWVHHFSIFVPLMYLLAAVVACEVQQHVESKGWISVKKRSNYLSAVALSLCAGVLVFNFAQQQKFFEKLDATGGVGRASNALSVLAEEAQAEDKIPSIYFFPDWGFFMSFAMLTGNKIPYQLEVTPKSIANCLGKGWAVRIAFWKNSDRQRYEEIMSQVDSVMSVTLKEFPQRNGDVAFYTLSATSRLPAINDPSFKCS
jgi:hypothetical protein